MIKMDDKIDKSPRKKAPNIKRKQSQRINKPILVNSIYF